MLFSLYLCSVFTSADTIPVTLSAGLEKCLKVLNKIQQQYGKVPNECGCFEIASPIGSYLVTQFSLNFFMYFPLSLLTSDTIPVTLSAGLENVSKFLYTVPTVSSSFGVVQKRQIVQISAIYTVSIACDSDNMRPRYHWRIFGKLFLLLQNLVLENLKFF